MSNYENYSKTSDNYDHTRIPVGVEIICGCLAQNTIPLAQQYLLDAGCGTGNYSSALLSHVGQISAVDLNEGMLKQARQKCLRESAAGRIDFHQAEIHSLPFDDAVFDGIMINQVLHHLELLASNNYAAYRAVFTEFARVLKPGGALIINTCSHEQLRHGFWYYDLFLQETRHMCERHASLELFQQLMNDAGIDYQSCFVPLDGLMQGEDYFNPRGPLSEHWRHGDSIWSTLSAAKLNEIKVRIREFDESGELESYLHKNDARRKQIGQLSFLFGLRQA